MDNYCSLKKEAPQLIMPGTTYTTVSFTPDDVSTDTHAMLKPAGLIMPCTDGFGFLWAMLKWADAGEDEVGEYRDRFIRDPFGIKDTTATDHRTGTPGQESWTKSWGIKVFRDQPVALQVLHTSAFPQTLILAEFKLFIIEGATNG